MGQEKGERGHRKKMCPDLHREIIVTETPSFVLHAITVNQPLQVASAFFIYLKPDQTLFEMLSSEESVICIF